MPERKICTVFLKDGRSHEVYAETTTEGVKEFFQMVRSTVIDGGGDWAIYGPEFRVVQVQSKPLPQTINTYEDAVHIVSDAVYGTG